MIAIANDHSALAMKAEICALLKEKGLEYKDFGTNDAQSCDYPEFGKPAANAVASGECELGILICGTGVGMSLVANKTRGVRCVVCSEPYSAKLSRQHNDSNMLSLGARVIGPDMARMIVNAWLDAEYEGGRHARRVAMLEDGK